MTRRDRDGGEQTTNLDNTASPSKVCMCGVWTQKWPSTQITLFERTRQSAWLDAVTRHWQESSEILSIKTPLFLFEGVEQPKKSPQKLGNALSDALIMSCFKNLVASAAKKKRYSAVFRIRAFSWWIDGRSQRWWCWSNRWKCCSLPCRCPPARLPRALLRVELLSVRSWTLGFLVLCRTLSSKAPSLPGHWLSFVQVWLLETCWYTSIPTSSCNSCVGVFVLRSFSLCSLSCFVSKYKYIYTYILLRHVSPRQVNTKPVRWPYPSHIVAVAPCLKLYTRPLPWLHLLLDCCCPCVSLNTILQ